MTELKTITKDNFDQTQKTLAKVMGFPIAGPDHIWCICGTKHPIKQSILGHRIIKCDELSMELKAATRYKVIKKALTVYCNAILNMTHDQKVRATEIIIARRTLDYAESKKMQANDESKTLLDKFVQKLYKASYLFDLKKGAVLSIPDGNIEIDFSGGSIEESPAE